MQVKTKSKKRTSYKPRGKRATQYRKNLRAGAFFVGFVVFALIGLSLKHLTEGVCLVCNVPWIEGLLMGVGLDLGLVAVKVADILVRNTQVQDKIKRLTQASVGICLLFSAAFNALAFALAASTTLYAVIGVTLGVCLPVLYVLLTKVGSELWLAGQE